MAPKIKEKICESCGQLFLCEEGGCWCDAIDLSQTALETIHEKYKDCLCEACLKAIATGKKIE